MNKWSKSEKGLLFAVTLAAAVYVCGLDTKAMHIMEGYLPAGYCIAWGAVCLPVPTKPDAKLIDPKTEKRSCNRHTKSVGSQRGEPSMGQKHRLKDQYDDA